MADKRPGGGSSGGLPLPKVKPAPPAGKPVPPSKPALVAKPAITTKPAVGGKPVLASKPGLTAKPDISAKKPFAATKPAVVVSKPPPPPAGKPKPSPDKPKPSVGKVWPPPKPGADEADKQPPLSPTKPPAKVSAVAPPPADKPKPKPVVAAKSNRSPPKPKAAAADPTSTASSAKDVVVAKTNKGAPPPPRKSAATPDANPSTSPSDDKVSPKSKAAPPPTLCKPGSSSSTGTEVEKNSHSPSLPKTGSKPKVWPPTNSSPSESVSALPVKRPSTGDSKPPVSPTDATSKLSRIGSEPMTSWPPSDVKASDDSNISNTTASPPPVLPKSSSSKAIDTPKSPTAVDNSQPIKKVPPKPMPKVASRQGVAPKVESKPEENDINDTVKAPPVLPKARSKPDVVPKAVPPFKKPTPPFARPKPAESLTPPQAVSRRRSVDDDSKETEESDDKEDTSANTDADIREYQVKRGEAPGPVYSKQAAMLEQLNLDRGFVSAPVGTDLGFESIDGDDFEDDCDGFGDSPPDMYELDIAEEEEDIVEEEEGIVEEEEDIVEEEEDIAEEEEKEPAIPERKKSSGGGGDSNDAKDDDAEAQIPEEDEVTTELAAIDRDAAVTSNSDGMDAENKVHEATLRLNSSSGSTTRNAIRTSQISQDGSDNKKKGRLGKLFARRPKSTLETSRGKPAPDASELTNDERLIIMMNVSSQVAVGRIGVDDAVETIRAAELAKAEAVAAKVDGETVGLDEIRERASTNSMKARPKITPRPRKSDGEAVFVTATEEAEASEADPEVEKLSEANTDPSEFDDESKRANNKDVASFDSISSAATTLVSVAKLRPRGTKKRPPSRQMVQSRASSARSSRASATMSITEEPSVDAVVAAPRLRLGSVREPSKESTAGIQAVREWLREIGLNEKYGEKFISAGYDSVAFLKQDFGETDLDELGITDGIDRKKILDSLSAKTKPGPPAPVPRPKPKPAARRQDSQKSITRSSPKRSSVIFGATTAESTTENDNDGVAPSVSPWSPPPTKSIEIDSGESTADGKMLGIKLAEESTDDVELDPQKKREKEEDEFEELVQAEGLLGALGFEDISRDEDNGSESPPKRGLSIFDDPKAVADAVAATGNHIVSASSALPKEAISVAAEPQEPQPRKKVKETDEQAEVRRAVRELIRDDGVELWKPPYSDKFGKCTITKKTATLYANKLEKSPDLVYAALDKLRQSALKRLKMPRPDPETGLASFTDAPP